MFISDVKTSGWRLEDRALELTWMEWSWRCRLGFPWSCLAAAAPGSALAFLLHALQTTQPTQVATTHPHPTHSTHAYGVLTTYIDHIHAHTQFCPSSSSASSSAGPLTPPSHIPPQRTSKSPGRPPVHHRLAFLAFAARRRRCRGARGALPLVPHWEGPPSLGFRLKANLCRSPSSTSASASASASASPSSALPPQMYAIIL
ncbi:hypothetical protein EJ06DRAFT_296221 [Trichodelitschia bisporula]|uniref:Uncharacterized protein n=1 Tax=Trichodelitschia bisporula TaxID=703511 RepID=A0A6G1I6D2_9PEZI|nr:hypothetical protein EJ06DRAFT_296221 [Trichodelitschia bisporula]